MGTNGAFGGSGAAAWDQVRDEWTSLGVQSTMHRVMTPRESMATRLTTHSSLQSLEL